MATARSGDHTLYYETHGSGPATLFIHGSGGNHAAWWQQVVHFAARHTVITLDLRGFGRSSTPPAVDADDFPDDVLAVMDAAEVERAVLVGQSVGAVTALKAAVRHPRRVAGVVLAHSTGGMADPQLTDAVRADRRRVEDLPVLDRLLTPSFQEREPALTFLFRQMGTFNRVRLADIAHAHGPGPAADQVIASGVPLLFLTGEHDPVLRPTTVALAHGLVPGSRLDVVPGAPHSMYWEAPALFNAAIDRFLADLPLEVAS